MHRIFLYLLAIFLSFPALAEVTSAQESVQFKGLYECSLAGLVFAKIGIEADQNESHYTATGDIATNGMINLFVRHSSHTNVKATGKNFIYPEIIYESHYQTNKKSRFVSLIYTHGELSAEKLVPPENHAKRPEVAQSLKGTAADPLTLILKMRSKLIDALKHNTSTYHIDVYDGRRLTAVNFTVMGKRNYNLNGTDTPVIVVMARRKLVSGFTAAEISGTDTNEPPLYAYFTDDAKLWPIRLETHMSFGTMAATLTHECQGDESCLLGIQE